MTRAYNINTTLNPYVLSPAEVMDRDRVGYKIVAVADSSGLYWAAYRGLTDWSDQQVEDEGDKIGEPEARALFPVMAASGRTYRR